LDELQKDDEASWAGHTMEVMREGRIVWRIPFDRPSERNGHQWRDLE